MESRLISTQFGIYEPAAWDGTNQSGIAPLSDKVLVLCDAAQEVTKGGVLLPGQVQENQGHAATTGVMVARGPQAFAYDADRLVKWEGVRPEAGTRVYFQKYAGQEYMGRDGKMYRLMQDRSVAGMEATIG